MTTISSYSPGKQLKNYIGYARFPNFKNIAPGTTIEFGFPITALVGANGSGKSSVLHALWGMPRGYSTHKFWFSTELDPIREGGELGVARYVYGHWNEQLGCYVETRKARGKKRADYWEPTKATKGDGMPPMPKEKIVGKAQDRWLPVEKKVVYINFKSETSAFDRFFYFETGRTEEAKHAAMLREAKRLKRAVLDGAQTVKLYGTERVFENRLLNSAELNAIQEILGKQYKSARIIRHTFYPGKHGQDLSVIFERSSIEYSEAFAGSGEVAVVSAVVKLLGAEENSLILLDEPETSLHPGAQKQFLHFLLEQIKLKKHQVVLSTHSDVFVNNLPNHAIKVFEETSTGSFTAIPQTSPFVAFKRLGIRHKDTIRIVVEDELAAEIIHIAAQGLDVAEKESLDIVVVPGGAKGILSNYVPVMLVSDDKDFVYLDGDQRPSANIPNPDDIPPSDNNNLAEKLKSIFGCSPKFFLSGGEDVAGNKDAKHLLERKYFKWAKEQLFFLPKSCPEQIVLDAMLLSTGKGPSGSISSEEAKAQLRALLESTLSAPPKGSEVTTIAKYKLAELQSHSSDLQPIRDALKTMISKMPQRYEI